MQKLLVITGLPASGKTTLARQLSQRYRVPLLAKDAIKVPLLDVLGAAGPLQSRKLSDASFAVMFALGHEMLMAQGSVILEGNFRPGEHEAALRPMLEKATRVAQILCRVDEALRIQRLTARATDLTRHAGHRDADLASGAASAPLAGNDFLSIAGERFLYDAAGCDDGSALEAFDAWWRG